MKVCAKWQDQVGKHTKVGVSLVCLLNSKEAGGARKGRKIRGRVIGEVAKGEEDQIGPWGTARTLAFTQENNFRVLSRDVKRPNLCF